MMQNMILLILGRIMYTVGIVDIVVAGAVDDTIRVNTIRTADVVRVRRDIIIPPVGIVVDIVGVIVIADVARRLNSPSANGTIRARRSSPVGIRDIVEAEVAVEDVTDRVNIKRKLVPIQVRRS